MNISKLLAQREALLESARLANLAFAFARLAEFTQRIARAQLRGTVSLKEAAPEAECFWATLTAHEGSQSVIEEHFTDEDVLDLADVLAFVTDEDEIDLTFRLEELAEKFLAPIRHELEQHGVKIDREPSHAKAPDCTEGASGCAQLDEGASE